MRKMIEKISLPDKSARKSRRAVRYFEINKYISSESKGGWYIFSFLFRLIEIKFRARDLEVLRSSRRGGE